MNCINIHNLKERLGKMMNRIYETPDIRFLYVDETDLITTSPVLDNDVGDQEDDEYTKRYSLR